MRQSKPSCRYKFAVALLSLWMMTMVYLLSADYKNSANIMNQAAYYDSGEKHSLHSNEKYPRDTTVHVCLTSDENTIIGMIAAINSIWKNTRQIVMFHLVVNEAAASHLRYWISNSDLRVIDYEIKIFDAKSIENKIVVRGGRQELAKPMNYARYYYPKLFPDLHGKVIHIDDDCIVQGDIYEMAATELKEHELASFSEDCTSVSKRFSLFQNAYSNFLNFNNEEIQSLKMKPLACSFNTGVFVFDIDKWRQENVTEKLEYWMIKNTREDIYGNEKGGGGSQPPMMIVLYDRYSPMDPMWHVRHLGWTAGTRYSPHFVQHAKLLHWNGKYKPWKGVAQYSDIWSHYFVKDPLNKYKPVKKFNKKR